VTLREMEGIPDTEASVGHGRSDLEVREAGCADSMADTVFEAAGKRYTRGMTAWMEKVREERDVP
jgi:hypothetical protein